MNPSVVVVGLNHRTASLELREQLAVSGETLALATQELARLPHVNEAVLVATCNRVEVYAASHAAGPCSDAIRGYLSARAPMADVSGSLYELHGDAAIRHLFRVTASLDSMVVGEPQILGQVKEAFSAARTAGTVGSLLQQTMSRAFAAAKRVRTETQIGVGSVSIASVAVDLARSIFDELQNRKVLLLGAGKMALSAARALVQNGAKLAIANRSYAKAAELARAHAADAHPLDDLALLLPHVDVVLCSTGATRFVVTREMVQSAMKARRGRALFLIDIAVPRNVDPRVHDLDSVYVFDVDDLEKQVAQALNERGGTLALAERIVDDELRAFEAERRSVSVVPTITALRERFRATARGELERSFGGKLKGLDAEQRKAVEAMVEGMVNKLLHTPTVALRAQGATPEGPALAAVVRALFELPREDADEAGDAVDPALRSVVAQHGQRGPLS